MFGTFLLGTALVVGLIMLVLLVQPRPAQDVRADRLPYVGMALAGLLAVLALLGGLAVSA